MPCSIHYLSAGRACDKEWCATLSTSRKLFNNPKGREKIEGAFRNTKENFRFFIKPVLTRPGVFDNIRRKGVTPDPDSITVLYTNNVTIDNRPLTAWCLAHRIGHAIQTEKSPYRQPSEIMSIIIDIFKQKGHVDLVNDVNDLFTMRSARNRVLTNGFDFFGELVAQHIISGRVRFNRLDYQGIAEAEQKIDSIISEMLASLRGKILVL